MTPSTRSPYVAALSQLCAEYHFSWFWREFSCLIGTISVLNAWPQGFPRHLPLRTLFTLNDPFYEVSLGCRCLKIRCWIPVYFHDFEDNFHHNPAQSQLCIDGHQAPAVIYRYKHFLLYMTLSTKSLWVAALSQLGAEYQFFTFYFFFFKYLFCLSINIIPPPVLLIVSFWCFFEKSPNSLWPPLPSYFWKFHCAFFVRTC